MNGIIRSIVHELVMTNWQYACEHSNYT